MCADIVISSFYKFVDNPEFLNYREPLLDFCLLHNIKGSILLASEGINATIAGLPNDMDAVLAYIKALPEFQDLHVKISFANALPFKRMKVKLKKEIVTLGKNNLNLELNQGTYVEPKDWNKFLTEDPENTIILDTRNSYEVALGTFQAAIDPKIEQFRDLPAFVAANLEQDHIKQHKKIVTYCTGGIRCEKFTAYLIQQGFKHVYQLKDGILNYLKEIPAHESLWQGSCFVFDERVTV